MKSSHTRWNGGVDDVKKKPRNTHEVPSLLDRVDRRLS
jgi:hypothetical protein